MSKNLISIHAFPGLNLISSFYIGQYASLKSTKQVWGYLALFTYFFVSLKDIYLVLILWFFRSLTCASDIIVFFPNLFSRWIYKILSNHFPKQFNKVIPQQLFGFSLSPDLNIWKINTLLQASGKISEWSFLKKIVQSIKHNLILTDCFWCYHCLEFLCFSKISLPLLYFSRKLLCSEILMLPDHGLQKNSYVYHFMQKYCHQCFLKNLKSRHSLKYTNLQDYVTFFLQTFFRPSVNLLIPTLNILAYGKWFVTSFNFRFDCFLIT